MNGEKNKKITVKKTEKYGKGVFAVSDIKRGEVIHIMGGKKITLRDVVDRITSGNESEDDPLQIGRRTYLDLNEFSRTFNHSCNPNMGMRKTGELFAMRDIKPSEELTYDYSLTIAPTEWEMNCKCGSSLCRKKIGDVLSIPSTRREQYLKMGGVQTYMRKLLKQIKEQGKYVMPRYEVLALQKLHGNQVK